MPGPAWSYDQVLGAYVMGSASIPRCTEVLRYTGIDTGLDDVPDFVVKRIHKKGVKGHRIHEATRLVDKGTLDWGTLIENEALFVDCYERARNKYGFRVMLSETPMVAVLEGVGPVGMTIDRLIEFKAGPEDTLGYWLIDLKTTYAKKVDEWGVQLAAYYWGLQFAATQEGFEVDDFPETLRCGVLWLKTDKEAELIPYSMEDIEDSLLTFHAGLRICHWKMRKKGLTWLDLLKKSKNRA